MTLVSGFTGVTCRDTSARADGYSFATSVGYVEKPLGRRVPASVMNAEVCHDARRGHERPHRGYAACRSPIMIMYGTI